MILRVIRILQINKEIFLDVEDKCGKIDVESVMMAGTHILKIYKNEHTNEKQAKTKYWILI